ncbi:MAG: glycoside hydrolase family 44 protein [Chloroflexi bacterium]|nr:glycoside hydrolase family 44 protein [Chloroflexota bacterium]
MMLISAPTVRSAPAATLTIYDNALAAGWANWSWDTTVNFDNTAPVHAGDRSIAVTYTAAWGGLYLHANAPINLSAYETLRFWAHGGTSVQRAITIVANGNAANVQPITAPANAWTQFDVPLSALGSPSTLSDLYWQDNSGGAQPVFYLDDIELIGSGPEPGTTIALSIDAQADVHPINPDIYGLNFAAEALAAELNLPVRRWGGNSTSRYNWQSNLSNTGSDWYFENIPQDGGTSANGSTTDLFVEQDRRTGTKTILTVPLIGWVAKSSSPRQHPYACGFKVSVYGAQITPPNQPWLAPVDPWDTDCGTGVSAGGDITGNNPLDTSTAISPTFVAQWVAHLIGRYGTAANGGVKFYNLDNEPMLWNSTHRDVHPAPATYDELRDKTVQYAAAIKAADPMALTLGPVPWGWCAYFHSARDGCTPGLDYSSHSNTYFVPWYLQQMAAYQQQHGGTRILDYLDLHYYPQADGVSLSGAGNAATQALRLRSTRSLWDAGYADESWISDGGGMAVQLIPRMKAWVNANYPGTKLAITEYNWGALDHINGALAQAEVLGIFGREGLDLATLWSPPEAIEPGAFAFRLYRNYDAAPVGAGADHAFGETSVRAVSADQDRLAIYAARRGADNALTVMVINKSLTEVLTGTVSLAGYDPAANAAVYGYSAANLTAILRASDQAIGPGGFTAIFPPSSITLLIIPPGVPLTPRVWLPIVLVR